MNRTTRAERAGQTRELILQAAEHLFARYGVVTVSNRQISEAAGQGNNTAVGYHFGTKADLVRAIVRKHSGPTEQIRERLLTKFAGSTQPRDWVTCLVQPVTEHLASLGTPSWYARFSAQVLTEPALRDIALVEGLAAPAALTALERLNGCVPNLPTVVRAERNEMIRNLVVYTCAEQERAFAEGTGSLRPTWAAAATGLIDATLGLLTAPVTTT